MKSRIGLITGIFMMTAAGPAGAAPAELNIFGSSSQYVYLNRLLEDYAHTLGCAASAPLNTGGKHSFVSATNCTNMVVPVNPNTGKRDLNIRLSSAPSAEGLRALNRQTPYDAAFASGCNFANGERNMYASSDTLTCKEIHVGLSDVVGESLTQMSSGHKLGPMGGDAFYAALSGVDTSNLTMTNTVVVPFGFFVNSAVTAKTCTAGLTGNYCIANTECDTAPSKLDGVCGAPATISNISREEATLIFSGYVSNWKDLGDYFVDLPAVVCLQHAGSGAHAALDLTVMNSVWGANTISEEIPDRIWFNQGSTDEMKCINGTSTYTPSGSLIGSIGYAVADQAIGMAKNVRQLKYNGVYPTRAAIRNGQYDFYTNAWLYTRANDASVNALVDNLADYLRNPANVPADKANYWATIGEMKYNRIADVGYPMYWGASNPMLP